MQLTQEARRIIIETVWGEARGELPIGQAAVTWVILNRAAESAWWGTDPASVCLHPWQFSCRNANDPNSHKLAELTGHEASFLSVANVVDQVLADGIEDPTNGATFYKVTGTKAEWDNAAVGKPTTVIGHHTFVVMGPKD